tara:strand:+ start:822 stop:1328 length:507 start_codon:yes stop_codon:yes gene_type:complete
MKDIGGTEFITSVSQEDHEASNRLAKVISLPINYDGPVEQGDTLLVHHNVFKFYYDMQGRQKSGRSYLKDNLFLVDNEQFFLYKRKGKWNAHGKYCFIKPAPLKDSYVFKGGNEEPLFGTVKYINQELLDLGVQEGDEISFQPDSEYPFMVDDEKVYRMFTKNITMII